VWTSARRQARAIGGFSDFLKQLEASTCVPA
ncbi:glycosyltransferase family 2 protein, partial [Xanthomonas perforans]|nr:glycosyltransferase family 2 protein [Xanthomonas perforans]